MAMALVDLFLPPACAGCGRYGADLCTRCRGSFQSASDPRDRFLAADPGIVVGDELEVAIAAFAYEGAIRRALSRLKYGGAARLAVPLADAALPVLRRLLLLTGPARLTPVPVHAERLRQRGYNQAALLAQSMAHMTRTPLADLLVRRRPTTQQHGLDRAARLRNLRAAFAFQPAARPPPTVVLVDDILTTSATLEACAAVLRDHGVHRVVGLAVAREI
jgi:ComF family protein